MDFFFFFEGVGMGVAGDSLKTFLERSVDHIICRDYIANGAHLFTVPVLQTPMPRFRILPSRMKEPDSEAWNVHTISSTSFSSRLSASINRCRA